MATLKWKNDKNWETFFYGAFENIKADLRNIIKAINNAAAAIRMRCRRDYNLADLYSASEGRRNLELIDDCSDAGRLGTTTHHHDSHHLVRAKNLSDVFDAAESRTNLELINDCSALPQAPHHHDSRYKPLIDALNGRVTALEQMIALLMSQQGGDDQPEDDGEPSEDKEVYICNFVWQPGMSAGKWYWIGNGTDNIQSVINDFVEKCLVDQNDAGSQYSFTMRLKGYYKSGGAGNLRGTPQASGLVGAINGGNGMIVKGYARQTYSPSCEALWSDPCQGEIHVTDTWTKYDFDFTGNFTISKGQSDAMYFGIIANEESLNGIINYDSASVSLYISNLSVDGKRVKMDRYKGGRNH